MPLVQVHLTYLTISLGMTIWVARVLHRNGRAFLLDIFEQNETLTDSVNNLLVVGFYLINIGYIAIALKYGEKGEDLESAIEALSTKIGCAVLVLGVIHFLNIYFLTLYRNSQLRDRSQ